MYAIVKHTIWARVRSQYGDLKHTIFSADTIIEYVRRDKIDGMYRLTLADDADIYIEAYAIELVELI